MYFASKLSLWFRIIILHFHFSSFFLKSFYQLNFIFFCSISLMDDYIWGLSIIWVFNYELYIIIAKKRKRRTHLNFPKKYWKFTHFYVLSKKAEYKRQQRMDKEDHDMSEPESDLILQSTKTMKNCQIKNVK